MKKQQLDSFWAPLHCLIVLAEQGSYTKAAARLDVSKASVSQRITELEKATGVALVSRTTRSVRLTDAGLRLVEDTQKSFEQIADSLASIRDSSVLVHGLVRVTAPVAFSRQQLVPKLPEFLRSNPKVRVQLEASDQIVSLAAEGFDLAVRHDDAVPDTHVSWALCRTESILVASPDYIAKRGLPRAPNDLAKHECLYYPRGVELPTWSFERMDHRGLDRSIVRISITGPFATNNSESLRDAALSGLGIALLPDFSAQTATRDGSLVRVLPGWKPVGAFAENLFLVRPYAARVPRAVSALVTYLRSSFESGFLDEQKLI